MNVDISISLTLLHFSFFGLFYSTLVLDFDAGTVLSAISLWHINDYK